MPLEEQSMEHVEEAHSPHLPSAEERSVERIEEVYSTHYHLPIMFVNTDPLAQVTFPLEDAPTEGGF